MTAPAAATPSSRPLPKILDIRAGGTPGITARRYRTFALGAPNLLEPWYRRTTRVRLAKGTGRAGSVTSARRNAIMDQMSAILTASEPRAILSSKRFRSGIAFYWNEGIRGVWRHQKSLLKEPDHEYSGMVSLNRYMLN